MDGIISNKAYIKYIAITALINAYMQYIVIKGKMNSILFDYTKGVEEENRDQMPKLCNIVESGEVTEETRLEHEDNKKHLL